MSKSEKTLTLESGRIIEDAKLWEEATENALKVFKEGKTVTATGKPSESEILGEYKKLGGKFHK